MIADRDGRWAIIDPKVSVSLDERVGKRLRALRISRLEFPHLAHRLGFRRRHLSSQQLKLCAFFETQIERCEEARGIDLVIDAGYGLIDSFAETYGCQPRWICDGSGEDPLTEMGQRVGKLAVAVAALERAPYWNTNIVRLAESTLLSNRVQVPESDHDFDTVRLLAKAMSEVIAHREDLTEIQAAIVSWSVQRGMDFLSSGLLASTPPNWSDVDVKSRKPAA